MSNGYVTTLLVDQRLAELHREADQSRLARLAGDGRPRRRWWERLMLGRTGTVEASTVEASIVEAGSRAAGRRPVATVATGDSGC